VCLLKRGSHGLGRRRIVLALWSLCFSLIPAAAPAQDAAHDHTQMNMPANSGWQLMQDGIVFAELNHQGGPRGGNEFVVPNWWMGMASRGLSRGRLTFTGMLSLDPATVGKDGYREIFQAGEALNGRPLIDRQHPHDLFMQLAAIWRMPIGESTGVTLAGGPVGEPALGPSRSCIAPRLPTIPPLRSVTTRSTRPTSRSASSPRRSIVARLSSRVRCSMGVSPTRIGGISSWPVGLRLRPRLVPAQRRVGAPGVKRAAQGPEQLGPGNIVRSTASRIVDRQNGMAISSVTAAYGRNNTDHGGRSAMFVEGVASRRLEHGVRRSKPSRSKPPFCRPAPA